MPNDLSGPRRRWRRRRGVSASGRYARYLELVSETVAEPADPVVLQLRGSRWPDGPPASVVGEPARDPRPGSGRSSPGSAAGDRDGSCRTLRSRPSD
jgi:hypothetical protein